MGGGVLQRLNPEPTMKTVIQINDTRSCNGMPLALPRHEGTEGIRLLTEQQVAELLMVCRRQLYNWRKSGFIPYIKLGKAVRFRLVDVEAAIAKFTIQNEPKP
jgi:excisionase family DNA binding protein